MPVRWARVVRDAIELRGRLPSLGAEEMRPSQVFATLRGLEATAVQAWAVIAREPQVRRRLLDYSRRLRHVKPELNGHDLLALGVPAGPAVGQLLERLLVARLDGTVSSRTDEVELVEKHA